MTISNRPLAWLRRSLLALAAVLLVAVPAHAGFLGLAWNANAEANISGYIVFYGTESGNYATAVDVGNATTWSDSALTDGQPYFFVVRAYNTDGVQSDASAELSATPSAKAQLTAPVAGTALTTGAATFRWSTGSGVTKYRLSVGSTFGGTDIFNKTLAATKIKVSTLPTTGTVYVRLWSQLNTTWSFTDYTYATTAGGSTTSYLSDRTWTSMTNGYGPVEKDRSNGESGDSDGLPLTLNGVTYAKGLGAHAASDVRYALNGACSMMTALVGVDDEMGDTGSVVFQVWVDGVQRYDSGVMTADDRRGYVNVDLTGASELALILTDAGDGNDSDHGDWANAQISCRVQ